jgi:hypothetical protein
MPYYPLTRHIICFIILTNDKRYDYKNQYYL